MSQAPRDNFDLLPNLAFSDFRPITRLSFRDDCAHNRNESRRDFHGCIGRRLRCCFDLRSGFHRAPDTQTTRFEYIDDAPRERVIGPHYREVDFRRLRAKNTGHLRDHETFDQCCTRFGRRRRQPSLRPRWR